MPNFKISADRATSSTINVYIRGVGQSDPLWGFQPAVGVYIDDVYLARPQTALLDVIDVQDLEILRGPQGTLYGKNTIAGAIKYVTRDIDGPATLTASATGGNYGEHDEKLYFSTPVIDDHVYFGIGARGPAARRLRRSGGPARNRAEPLQLLGQDVSNKDVLAGRANLTIKWGESSKLKLIAFDILDNSNAAGGQRLNNYLAPQLERPVRHAHRHAGRERLHPPQRRIGDLHPEFDRPAQFEGRRRLHRRPEPAVHQFRRAQRRTCSRYRAPTTINSPRARRS